MGCLYFATRGTDWARVGSVLGSARPLWILAVTLASLATVYIRAQRWRVLLRPVGEVPLYAALSATAIGFGATSVLPASGRPRCCLFAPASFCGRPFSAASREWA